MILEDTEDKDMYSIVVESIYVSFILFYMNKVTSTSPPTPHIFFQFSCSYLGLPIESELMDRF